MRRYRHLCLRDFNRQFSAPLSAKNPKPPYRGLSHHESPPSSRFHVKSRLPRTSTSAHSTKPEEKFKPSSRLSPQVPPSNKRLLGSGPSPRPPTVWNQATKISVSDFFNVFTPVSQRFYRCSVCGNRVKSNIYYLFLHTYVCRNAICDTFLKDTTFRQRLSEILFEIRQTQEVEKR